MVVLDTCWRDCSRCMYQYRLFLSTRLALLGEVSPGLGYWSPGNWGQEPFIVIGFFGASFRQFLQGLGTNCR